jgi:hypothetical protein
MVYIHCPRRLIGFLTCLLMSWILDQSKVQITFSSSHRLVLGPFWKKCNLLATIAIDSLKHTYIVDKMLPSITCRFSSNKTEQNLEKLKPAKITKRHSF